MPQALYLLRSVIWERSFNFSVQHYGLSGVPVFGGREFGILFFLVMASFDIFFLSALALETKGQTKARQFVNASSLGIFFADTRA